MTIKRKGTSSISYLQAKILETIFLDIIHKKLSSIENIALKTHYKKDSKILINAVNSVIKKGFVIGDFDNGFSIPDDMHHILELIKHNNNIKLDYKKSNQLDLIDFRSIEDLVNSMDNWYSYVEEFSGKLIIENIENEKLSEKSLIYDPFIGSGTTAIVSNLLNHNFVGFDANPLMKFVSEVNTSFDLSTKKIKKYFFKIEKEFLKKSSKELDQKEIDLFFKNIPKKELDQWLSKKNQRCVYLLKGIIKNINEKKYKNLFLAVLSKTAFDTSYVSLCPGTTFYPFRVKNDFWDDFKEKLNVKISHLIKIKELNFGSSKIYEDNSNNSSKYIEENKIDLAITSPPYPNDLEYTRQTRLELYILDFVKSMNDVAVIKKNMVKSSTKLIYKESSSEIYIQNFQSVLNLSSQIHEKLKNKNWGWDYPRMVREYFGDMYICLKETHKLLKKNSKFILVCGDQTIQGIYIPVCDILVEFAKQIGYESGKIKLYRNRRSTSHNILLPENLVILKK